MISAILEVRPLAGQWDNYLGKARLLRSDLEQGPGFVDNHFYRSLTREGWILSLAALKDEQAMLHWRRLESRRGGTAGLLADGRLRAGQVAFDTRAPEGGLIIDPGDKRMEADGNPAVTLIDALQRPDWVNARNPEEIALYLGFDPYSYGDCISWDVLDSIDSPGAIILIVTWKGFAPALDFAQSAMVPDDARVRAVGGVCEYGIEGIAFTAGETRGDSGSNATQGAANDR